MTPAADDRQADRARSAPLRRIRRDAHGEDRHADRFEIVEVAHQAVGDEAGDAAVARDIHAADRRSRRRRYSRPSRRRAHRPACDSASAAMSARLSSGPQSQVSATPTSERPTSRLDPPVERARAVHRVDDEAGRRAEALDESADGRSIDGAKTSGGGSSIMGDLVSHLFGGAIAPHGLESDRNARSTRAGNRSG